MLNGIFGKWLREFATLVLTQTVQAFLLAVVMTIIISCIGNSDDATSGNQAAGLLAIIAFASFGKIEMLVKNIFGVTSQFGDPSLANGAKGLTAGSLLALKGGKRLLDNGTKFVDSSRKIKEAKRGLAALKDDDTNKNELGEEKKSDTKLPNDGNLEKAEDLAETSVKLEGLKDISNLNEAIKDLSKKIEKSNGGSDKDKNREKYESMLKEGKEMRRSAIRENIGATIGGTAGAIVGLAQGDKIVEKTLTGAGAGDAIGQATADRKAQKVDYNNRMKKLQSDIDKLTEAEFKKNIKDLTNSLEKTGLSTRGSSKNYGIEQHKPKNNDTSNKNTQNVKLNDNK